jgi:predicted flap endonuclease-1-like 5' DNA nuclease
MFLNDIRQWFWVLLILVVGLPILWWWVQGRAEEKTSQHTESDAAARSSVVEISAPAGETTPPPVEPVAPDDLREIEGIGPKISSWLQAAGITTFDQLAAADVEQLRRIVYGAGLRIADPSTWPEQAALAAAGKWDELEALQDELKGGRRV